MDEKIKNQNENKKICEKKIPVYLLSNLQTNASHFAWKHESDSKILYVYFSDANIMKIPPVNFIIYIIHKLESYVQNETLYVYAMLKQRFIVPVK